MSLRRALGTAYELLYPKMPHESEPDYRNWKTQIGKKLGHLKNGAILVGHSLGGSFLLKYLSDEKVEKAIAGIFLIATPYWGGDGWRLGYEAVSLPKDFPSKLPSGTPIFFYHSRADEIVPFRHLTLYAKKLAQATFSRPRCAWASVKKTTCLKLPRISRVCNEPTQFVQFVSFEDLS